MPGFLVGALTIYLVSDIAGDLTRVREPSIMLAVIAGLSYGLIGAVVGAGLIAPRAGARFLNVPDEQEIADESAKLWPSALSSVLIGVFFLGLALAPSFGSSHRGALAGGLGLCAAGTAACTIWARRHSDELTKRLSAEASALTLNMTILLLGGWATLAHLGFGTWASPLTFLAAVALLMLVAIFWVAAKRGLLSQR